MPRGGRRERSTKVDGEIRDAIEEMVNMNPAITLVEIRDELQQSSLRSRQLVGRLL